MGIHRTSQDEISKSLSVLLSEFLKQDMSEPGKNFLDCGLTSSLAIQLISRVRDLYEVELPIVTLFQMETATISGLSRYIAELKWCQQASNHDLLTDSKELVL